MPPSRPVCRRGTRRKRRRTPEHIIIHRCGPSRAAFLPSRPLPDHATDRFVTDSDLLARLRQGDHAAFDAIFRQWYEPVVRSANRIVHDPGVAEELAQDVMLELWRRREQLPDGSSVPGYLLQAARNRALNHLRHLQVQKKAQVFVEALTEPAEHADADAEARELEVAIREAIAELPPRTREVFLMSRERNLRYGEIAEQLGVTVKAVEANMSRALRQLREKLSPYLRRHGAA